MKKNLFVLFSVIIIAGACSAPMPDIDDTLPVVQPNTSITVEPNNPSPTSLPVNNIALNPPHGKPGHDCNIAVGAPLNGSVNSMNSPLPIMPSANNPLNNSSTHGVRLNPPHGERGHDCGVQVGQPLS